MVTAREIAKVVEHKASLYMALSSSPETPPHQIRKKENNLRRSHSQWRERNTSVSVIQMACLS